MHIWQWELAMLFMTIFAFCGGFVAGSFDARKRAVRGLTDE